MIHGYIVTASKRVGKGIVTAVLGVVDDATDTVLRDHWRAKLPDATVRLERFESSPARRLKS